MKYTFFSFVLKLIINLWSLFCLFFSVNNSTTLISPFSKVTWNKVLLSRVFSSILALYILVKNSTIYYFSLQAI
ncbi:hypothetical protein H8356DRAFT_1663013 [Neocallimastix lanati (nom. inval.)]|nr:hypothetical protein H8356DRAFT_1663013 [Neocallimastix sp. JGI-2020a]